MLPEAFLQRMRAILGPEYDAFLAAYDRPRHVGLRLNRLKTDRIPNLPFLRGSIPWEPDGFFYDQDARPGLHPYHDAGVYYLQEPSAMSAARLLDVKPGERALDLCAAPGGKATQMAAAMRGEGLLVCNEYHPGRAKILSRNLERMGVANALVLNETSEKLAAWFADFFDKILVDAPCSGEGMFRKEAAAVDDWSVQTVQRCARRQLEILHNAAQMLRGGGRLVYSTCTFAPEEDEDVVRSFLQRHPDFFLEAADAPWFSPALQGRGADAAVRLWPHKLEGEGHFAAVLQREDGPRRAVPEEPGIRLPGEYAGFPELPEGQALYFGQTLYWMPVGMPKLRGLRVLRPGLALGQVRKGRLEPEHALALWAKEAEQSVCFAADSPEIARYLRGETLPGNAKGWVLVQVDGFSIGWAKGANGMLKNHLPKGLRRISTKSVANL